MLIKASAPPIHCLNEASFCIIRSCIFKSRICPIAATGISIKAALTFPLRIRQSLAIIYQPIFFLNESSDQTSTLCKRLLNVSPEKNSRWTPIMGNQIRGSGCTNKSSGKPNAAPPKPIPVRTNPAHINISERAII
ncbi:MAG: Unknown protein [uncultured Thiotrichaceae bacterium]|uniref:Uncharacterized protein n=1 Tax=uncultured Thiotrichaceae bacterium TaxID=298394 RepID=A0A6S6U0N6_9GAMM|nr:MAG: Unknown protein [uncultured Thiotrichaceae bacterium]